MRGSFLFLDQTKENKFGGGEKRKKGRKERKTKERRDKKSVRGKGRKKGKERKKEKREMRESVVRFPLFDVSIVGSR